ncbi:SSY1 [Candida pseudojiufengensis]|uniref:SSY1 n=1 Tax=Candida pseudojiufengensis TaxID=497109 RepID=UPI00222419A2|nr:SSY1 [Candida pseudojiufengensis]KAI5964886.1 SSY1 [Candida pseudojiufengensis]
MPHDIDSEESDISFTNGLFPSLNKGRKQSDDESIESGSISHLRDVFRNQSVIETDSSIKPQQSSVSLSPTTTSKDDNYSIHSSIIDDMAKNLTSLENDRFKYIRSYEKLSKSKKTHLSNQKILHNMKSNTDIPLQTLNSNGSSIFELSRLNDFDKFVKETSINDQIQGRLLHKLPKHEQEQQILNIVQEQDLGQRFYAGNEISIEGKSNKLKTLFNNKSSKKEKEEPEFVTNSEISGLYYPSTDSTIKNNSQYLHRSLKIRHLQMISLGGTIGVGLFLNSGKAINIAGGFGAVLAFSIVGVVVLFTMMSFCEMVTFVSVIDGVSGLSSRFVDDAFGFATGWVYFLSFAFGVAGEIVAGVIMLSYWPYLNTTTNRGSTTGFVTLFLSSILASNLIDVRVFGEIEYISSLIKLLWAVVMMFFMILLNRGVIGGGPVLGFRYWDKSKSDFENNIIFGLFRPTFNLYDSGTNPPTEGIGGNTGRFLSLLTAILVVCYAYSGTEIVCIAACEAKNPRKALPSATKRVFWRIVIFYCLSAFLVTLNVYAGDPRLLRYLSGKTGIDKSEFATNIAIQSVGGAHCAQDSEVFAGYGSGAQSAWIVALQSAGLCRLSNATNVFLVFFAVSCGNAQLYVSSRTVYALALQGKAPKFLTYCNKHGIPYNAVLLAGSFGLLSYTCVSESATVVFQNLNSVIASSGIFVWFAMCLTFIRFYFGLKRRPDILKRTDKSYPYKSFGQPYSAIVGMLLTAFIMLSMGFVVFLKHEWNTMFFFSSYGPLMTFAVLYIGYRMVKGSTIPSLDKLDFDSGRTEMDAVIWDGGNEYNRKSLKEVLWKWISFLA